MDVTRSNTIVRRSAPGLGRGLFAAHPLEKHDFIVEYVGERISTRYADRLKTRYLFELDEAWTIDGSSHENVARYINHSCFPNAEARLESGRILIHAARDIETGEEVTIDYGDEYFEEYIDPAGCKCETCLSPSPLVAN